MPAKPLRPCSYFGCRELVRERYCDNHRREEHKAFKKRRTDQEEQAFYNSPAWRALRQKKIRRDPLCEECMRQGVITPATMVDHIKPIKDGGARLDMQNLQSLDKACHNRKTAREG